MTVFKGMLPRKEGNGLFNDTFNTFYIRLHDIGELPNIYRTLKLSILIINDKLHALKSTNLDIVSSKMF